MTKYEPAHSTHGLLSAQEIGSFFNGNRTQFLAHARRLLGSQVEAEEVVQDALVRVLLASPELESLEHAKAYFHKVIENLSIDVHRRQGRQPRLVVLDDSTVEIESRWFHDSDLTDTLARADDAAIIREAISLLSPAERAALVMWEFDGRSTFEIAHELGVKESAVRHTVSRARASLRRLLSERIVDEERGLTALDLLSVTFHKVERVAQKSSKIALSLIIVFSAFIGFNTLSSSDLMTGQLDASVTQSAPEPIKTPNASIESQVNSGVEPESRMDSRGSESNLSVKQRDQVRGFNASDFGKSFLGLDSSGIPTSFTVADSLGNLGALFPGQQRVVPTESGVLLSSIVSTRSDAANVLIDQLIVVDSFGTSYLAEVSVGIDMGWQPLNLSFISSDVERLASGNYLLTAIMLVDSVVETAIKVSTGTSGTDLRSAPEFISTRVLLDPTKTKILAQAVLVSADSQGDGA